MSYKDQHSKRKRCEPSESEMNTDLVTGKRLKSNKCETNLEKIKSDLDSLSSIKDTLGSIEFFQKHFPKHFELPPIIYQHQIYSAMPNKTKVDREIESLRIENKIILFKSDSVSNEVQDDISICFLDDFKQYVENILIDNNPKLPADLNEKNKFINTIRKFLNETITETKELSVTDQELKLNFSFKEADITTLIHAGLLTIKENAVWWFSIPSIGKFRRVLLDARRSVLNLIKKKRYNELNVDEVNVRNMKSVNQIGIVYILYDLIGKEAIRKVDSPLANFIIKLC